MRQLSSFAWVLASAFAASQAAASTDPLEFIETYRDADSAQLKELKKKLREEKAALLKAYNSDEIKKKREELAREKTKKFLIEDLQSKFAGKVNSTDELQTFFNEFFSKEDKKAELDVFGKALESKRNAKADSAEAKAEIKPVEAVIAIEGSPVHLVAKISADANNKPVMEFNLDSNDDLVTKNIRREAKTLTPSEAQDFFKSEASKKLFEGKRVEIANFKGANVEEWSKSAAEQASTQIFKEQARKELDALAKDKSPNDPESKVYQLGAELEDMEDKKGRREELKQASADEKIRTWLEENSVGNLTDCEVLIKAVPLEEIPEKAKQKCAESDPKMKVLTAKPGDKGPDGKPLVKSAKDAASGDGKDDPAAKGANAQPLNPSQDWFQAARGCAAYQRQLAAMSQTSAMNRVTSPLQAIYQSMLGSGFVDCPLYNQMMDTGVLGSPWLYDAQGKAQDVLSRNYTQNTYDNYKKLQSSAECVRKILSVTSAMLNNLSPNGVVDPFMMMDPNIQRMMMHQSAARELMGAIENSLSARVAENKWKMQVGPGGSTMGVPVVGGGGAGAGSWRPMGGGSGRPADRRLAPSGARNGARGTRPSLLK